MAVLGSVTLLGKTSLSPVTQFHKSDMLFPFPPCFVMHSALAIGVGGPCCTFYYGNSFSLPMSAQGEGPGHVSFLQRWFLLMEILLSDI
jgi:hypothetical protein